MSDKGSNIDKFFRDRFDGHQESGDQQGAWAKMEQKLDPEIPQGRPVAGGAGNSLWYVLGFVAVATLVTWIFFPNKEAGDQTIAKTEQKASDVATTEQPTDNKNTETSTASDNNFTESGSVSTKEEEAEAVEDSYISPKERRKEAREEKAATREARREAKAATQGKEQRNTDTNDEAAKIANEPASLPMTNIAATPSLEPTSSTGRAETESTREEPVVSNDPSLSEVADKVEESVLNETTTSNDAVEEVIATSNMEVTSTDAEEEKILDPVASSEKTNTNVTATETSDPAVEEVVVSDNQEQEELALPDTSSAAPATEEPAATVAETPPPVEDKETGRLHLIATAGANFSKGFTNQNTGNSSVVNPSFAIGALYDLNKSRTMAISAEVEYQRSGGHALGHSTDSLYWFINQRLVSNKVNVKTIDRLNIPVNLYISASDKVRINVGGYYSRLLDTRADVIRTVTSTDGVSITERKNEKGFQDGIAQSTFGIQVGAEYKLFDRVFVGAMYRRDLNDTSLDDIYSNTTSDLASALRLQARFQLFGKK